MKDRSWMSFVMPFGKYKGDTLAIIRMNDVRYLVWASENIQAEPVRTELNKAIAYINETDPSEISRIK